MREDRVLIVGLGSIGQRHARLLCHRLHLPTAAVSARPNAAPHGVECFGDLPHALARFAPSYVVLANATADHHAWLIQLAQLGFTGRVLVEKPLFAVPSLLPKHGFVGLHTAYQLRFHPVLQALSSYLEGERVTTVQAYVGSWLPDWRPGRAYSSTASASITSGGGVLRDLSHELDYLTWLFGRPTRLAAIGGRVGELHIDCDDAWAIIAETPRAPVLSLQINYLDQQHRRELLVTTTRGSFHADLVNATLTVDGATQSFPVEQDGTYLDQHRAALAGDERILCSATEGLAVVDLIASIERANATGQWVVP